MISERFQAIGGNIANPNLKAILGALSNEEKFDSYKGKKVFQSVCVNLSSTYNDSNSLEVLTYMQSGKLVSGGEARPLKTQAIKTKSTARIVEDDCPDCPRNDSPPKTRTPNITLMTATKKKDDIVVESIKEPVKEEIKEEIKEPVKEEIKEMNPDSPETILAYFGSKTKLKDYARKTLGLTVSNKADANEIAQQIYNHLSE